MSTTTSPFTVLDGEGLDPEELAWSMIADAAAKALTTIPDLVPVAIDNLVSIHRSSRGAAGQPVEALPGVPVVTAEQIIEALT